MADNTTNTEQTAEASVPEAFQQLLAQLTELREYATYFVSAKIDRAKVWGRTNAVKAVCGVLGLLTLGMVLVTAVVLLLTGLAGGLAVLLHSGIWLGNTLVGLLMMVMITLGVFFGIQKWQKASAMQTKESYEQRQQHQQLTFGHSVSQRAREATE